MAPLGAKFARPRAARGFLGARCSDPSKPSDTTGDAYAQHRGRRRTDKEEASARPAQGQGPVRVTAADAASGCAGREAGACAVCCHR
eukprot:1844066-Prymnesium_polylepis.1